MYSPSIAYVDFVSRANIRAAPFLISAVDIRAYGTTFIGIRTILLTVVYDLRISEVRVARIYGYNSRTLRRGSRANISVQ